MDIELTRAQADCDCRRVGSFKRATQTLSGRDEPPVPGPGRRISCAEGLRRPCRAIQGIRPSSEQAAFGWRRAQKGHPAREALQLGIERVAGGGWHVPDSELKLKVRGADEPRADRPSLGEVPVCARSRGGPRSRRRSARDRDGPRARLGRRRGTRATRRLQPGADQQPPARDGSTDRCPPPHQRAKPTRTNIRAISSNRRPQ